MFGNLDKISSNLWIHFKLIIHWHKLTLFIGRSTALFLFYCIFSRYWDVNLLKYVLLCRIWDVFGAIWEDITVILEVYWRNFCKWYWFWVICVKKRMPFFIWIKYIAELSRINIFWRLYRKIMNSIVQINTFIHLFRSKTSIYLW